MLLSFRRLFILSLSTLVLFSCQNKSNSSENNIPIVISTWDSGIEVNHEAWKLLSTGQKSIDAVEKGANHIENTINCCVGLGGNPDRDGYVTLDASIMDHKFNCGSVSFLQRIKNPISVARRIMEKTPHVMLSGNGALQFALQEGFVLEPEQLSPQAEKTYKEWLESSEYNPEINIELQQKNNRSMAPPARLDNGEFNHDTMGLVALDEEGDLAGACTTSGMGFKMHGRVGDSPIIGAGLYVDNEVGAATSSGQGEEVIRICGTHLVVEYMRQGLHPEKACKKAIERLVKINPDKAQTFQVGFLALNKKGEYGAFSIQPGFVFSVTNKKYPNGKVLASSSYFD